VQKKEDSQGCGSEGKTHINIIFFSPVQNSFFLFSNKIFPALFDKYIDFIQKTFYN
jgi:hypothetical protein